MIKGTVTLEFSANTYAVALYYLKEIEEFCRNAHDDMSGEWLGIKETHFR